MNTLGLNLDENTIYDLRSSFTDAAGTTVTLQEGKAYSIQNTGDFSLRLFDAVTTPASIAGLPTHVMAAGAWLSIRFVSGASVFAVSPGRPGHLTLSEDA